MKKIAILMSALSLLAFASCEKPNQGPNLDEVVEDGFYVAGPATGATAVAVEYKMAVGVNEAAGKAQREGMYEKFVYLTAGQEFQIINYKSGEAIKYGAALENYDTSSYADNPKSGVLRGTVQTGESAPSMKVATSGLYHIIMDLNVDKAMSNAYVVVADANTWGVKGECNGWGFTAGETTKDGAKINFTCKDVKFEVGKTFKFSHCEGWKIQIDGENEAVKAETGLGVDLKYSPDNIALEKLGIYDIILTFELKTGEVSNSFSYEAKLKEEIIPTYPDNLWMTGDEFGNWFQAAGSVQMIPVAQNPGQFWTVRFLTAGKGFKFAPQEGWGGEFGADWGSGNATVETTGLYMIHANYNNNKLTIEPAVICGMGDAFGSWDAKKYPFTIAADGTATITTTAAGNLRMYAELTGGTDWWTREFNIYDGKIVYRGAGGDQAAVPVAAGQKVTLNFNTGVGTIK